MEIDILATLVVVTFILALWLTALTVAMVIAYTTDWDERLGKTSPYLRRLKREMEKKNKEQDGENR